MDDNKFLEQFYERIILPRYKDSINFGEVTWIDHGKVGLDAWAHFFILAGEKKQYALLYEDFPDGEYLKDGLSHEVIKCGDETSIELRFSDDLKQTMNITGWFTLFREK